MIWSCGPDKLIQQQSISVYYDINGLVDDQATLLDSISPSLLKSAIIDGNEAIQEIAPTDSSWEKELAIFKSADINKPILTDSYIALESVHTGIKNIIYTSKYPEATEVDSMSISFEENELKPLKIYARLSNENLLFTSKKILEISFHRINEKHLISRYQISGWQKMISMDSTNYFIDAVIKYH